jgi:hypothetical protein
LDFIPAEWQGSRKIASPFLCHPMGWLWNDLLTVDFILAENWLSEVFEGRLCLSLEGNSLNVVSREGLRMMKKASARAQDLADLEKLDGYHE